MVRKEGRMRSGRLLGRSDFQQVCLGDSLESHRIILLTGCAIAK